MTPHRESMPVAGEMGQLAASQSLHPHQPQLMPTLPPAKSVSTSTNRGTTSKSVPSTRTEQHSKSRQLRLLKGAEFMARKQDFISEARAANQKVWDGINELVSLQREWN